MGEWVAKVIVVAILALLFLGVPGGVVWLHFKVQGKGREARTGLISMVLGGALVLYGLLIADGYCDFRWDNFGWVSDASPKFSYGVAPGYRDYWHEAWPIYLWCFIGLIILARGCFSFWRENRDHFDQTLPLSKGRIYAGSAGLILSTAALAIMGTKAHEDRLAFEARSLGISRELDATLRQLTYLKQSKTVDLSEELEDRMDQLAFEIDERSNGRAIDYPDWLTLNQIARYWATHPDRVQSRYSPQRVERLAAILKQADPRF